MRFIRTEDEDVITSIVTHPKVYPYISDDFSPRAEEWKPTILETVWYMLVEDNARLLGLWIFVEENRVCWKVHTCLLPIAYGESGIKAACEMARWIWENTACVRIVTDVPRYNRLAFHFAINAGMTEFGVNPKSYMKHGKLQDVIMMGMSKPEVN